MEAQIYTAITKFNLFLVLQLNYDSEASTVFCTNPHAPSLYQPMQKRILFVNIPELYYYYIKMAANPN